MMRKWLLRGLPGLPLAMVLLSGCGSDREAELLGKWKPSNTYGTVTGVRLKEETPSTSPSQARNAGRLLAGTGMEIRKDKTFRLVWLGNTVDGTWTFNKESGEMLLNYNKVQPMLPATAQIQQPAQSGTYVAYLKKDNQTLRFYPMGPESVKLIEKGGGTLADGIPLKKQ